MTIRDAIYHSQFSHKAVWKAVIDKIEHHHSLVDGMIVKVSQKRLGYNLNKENFEVFYNGQPIDLPKIFRIEREKLVRECGNFLKDAKIFADEQLPQVVEFLRRKAFHLGGPRLMTECLKIFLGKIQKRKFIQLAAKEKKHYPEQLTFLKHFLCLPIKAYGYRTLVKEVKGLPELKSQVPPQLLKLVEALEGEDSSYFHHFLTYLFTHSQGAAQRFTLLSKDPDFEKKQELKQFLRVLGTFLKDYGYVHNLRVHMETKLGMEAQATLPLRLVNAILPLNELPKPFHLVEQIVQIFIGFQLKRMRNEIDTATLEQQMDAALWNKVKSLFSNGGEAFNTLYNDMLDRSEFWILRVGALDQTKGELKKFLLLWGELLLGLGTLYELDKKSPQEEIPLSLCNAFLTADGREKPFLKFPNLLKLYV